MTAISKAIAELREAMDEGGTIITILTKYDQLVKTWDTEHRSQELNNLINSMCIKKPFSLEAASLALTALESAVEGTASPTPVLTGVEKAAELCTMCGGVLFPDNPEFGKGQHTVAVADEVGDPSPAPCGPTIPYPVPDLTERIEKAAEEIVANMVVQCETISDVRDEVAAIAAIIRQFVEVR